MLTPRQVDWTAQTEELWMHSHGTGYELSRPVGRGEIIDFFVSHSWSAPRHSLGKSLDLAVMWLPPFFLIPSGVGFKKRAGEECLLIWPSTFFFHASFFFLLLLLLFFCLFEFFLISRLKMTVGSSCPEVECIEAGGRELPCESRSISHILGGQGVHQSAPDCRWSTCFASERHGM